MVQDFLHQQYNILITAACQQKSLNILEASLEAPRRDCTACPLGCSFMVLGLQMTCREPQEVVFGRVLFVGLFDGCLGILTSASRMTAQVQGKWGDVCRLWPKFVGSVQRSMASAQRVYEGLGFRPLGYLIFSLMALIRDPIY